MKVCLCCSFNDEISSAPRLGPWYTQKPTKEKYTEMDYWDDEYKVGILGAENIK